MSRVIAQHYGLVFVSVREMLKQVVSKNPDEGKVIKACIERGEPIPDALINSYVEKRLKQSDCRINGWVLEGFPYSKAQINMLRAMRIKPSHVVVFEQQEDESLRRIGNRKVDPQTGICYNIQINPPTEEAISNRLETMPGDTPEVVKKLYLGWKNQQGLIEESFKEHLI
jgi:adenylate kinase